MVGTDNSPPPASCQQAGRAARFGSAGAGSLIAIVIFALVGIGGPLVGQGVFAGTDEMVLNSPYRDAGLSGSVQNTYMDDTYDTIIPNTLLFADALRRGEIAPWNPFILGGVALGATPNFAVASPLTIPYYLLPGWLAPAYVKLLEISVAAGGCFLFARRSGLGRPAALMAGLVFVSSAFLVAWTNWPQTRTAAVIPFVFWALERLVQRGRWGDGALLAAAIAAMIFGGFPAVTGYTLLFAALYLVVRVLAEHRAGRWGRDVRVVLAAAGGVVAGIALTAVQLLPFASLMSTALVEGREQGPGDHLPHEALLTMIAPFALGTVDPASPPAFMLDVNLVEALSYVGGAALVLAAIGMAALRGGRAVLPRGAWVFLVVGTVTTVVVTYGGGLPLALLQQLPVLFAENYVGRIRSVFGFLVAILAAVGVEVLLRRSSRRPGWSRLGFAYAATVWLAFASVGAWIWAEARMVARAADAAAEDQLGRLAYLDQQVLRALAFVAVALLCAGLIYAIRGGRPQLALRAGLIVLLPVLIVVQALGLVREYWPRSDRETFYPITDVQRFLAAELEHDRFAFAGGAMAVGANAPHRLRALNGHTFVNAHFAELVEALPGSQFFDPPTLPVLGAAREVVTSPVLDRLGTRYYILSPAHPVLGVPAMAPQDGSVSSLVPGVGVRVPLTADLPLRAVGVIPKYAVPTPASTRIEVVLRDEGGAEVARASRTGHGMVAGEPFTIPIAAEAVVPGTRLTVELTVRGPQVLQVQAFGGKPAVSTVGAGDDGLRLVYAGNAIVYERLTALPRIRWASAVVVETDPVRRVELLASGTLSANQVVFGAPPAIHGDGTARLRVVEDGVDEIVVEVDAAAPGHLIVADALQNGWTAEVDGAPADVLPADHGLVAVAVPPGRHTVQWEFASRDATLGAWISGLTAMSVLGLAAVGAFRRRARRYRSTWRYAAEDPAGRGPEVTGSGSQRVTS